MSAWVETWLLDSTISRLVIAILGIVIITVLARVIVWVATRRILASDTRYRVRKVIAFGGYVAAILVLVVVYSSQLTGVGVAFGVAGAGIAFALQEVIASVAGWIALTFSRFYAPGDRIELGGIRGDVIDIGVLRTTLMQTGDWVNGDLYNGRIVRVANSFVFKEPVFNSSGDFPFLWDEIRVPVRYGGDRALARRILEDTVQDVVGDYTASAKQAWDAMLRTYRLEEARVDPMVTLAATDNWLEFTVRYVVDYRRRRSTKNALFTRILDAIDATDGRVAIASSTYGVVDMPTLHVQMDSTSSSPTVRPRADT